MVSDLGMVRSRKQKGTGVSYEESHSSVKRPFDRPSPLFFFCRLGLIPARSVSGAESCSTLRRRVVPICGNGILDRMRGLNEHTAKEMHVLLKSECVLLWLTVHVFSRG